MSQRCGTCKHWQEMRLAWGYCAFPDERMPQWVSLSVWNISQAAYMPESAGKECGVYERKST